ncbi:MAG TPA: hypothetical protein PKI05_01630 [Thermogutta sp.]|nr:hypothetical protein [Thermogutta sp.]HPU07181.1 hypothetical protein [Thermogutta sp.]HQF14067.1 hypothetical protein [Thermogutta sp.]
MAEQLLFYSCYWRRRFPLFVWAASLIWAWASAFSPIKAQLTPEHPAVRQAVERALAYLASREAEEGYLQIGARALRGLAFLKAGHAHDHPVIVKSAEEIIKQIPPSGLPKDFPMSNWDNYSTGLALIFLCNYDPQKFRQEIQLILQYSFFRQKNHGGWGYPSNETGDTSQTQYQVLGLWEAIRAGFAVPSEVLDKVALWLVWTQDPSGGYGYQGNFPPTPTLIPQSDVRIGMAVAGTGSAYVLASLLPGFRGTLERSDLPPALEKIAQARQAGRGRLTIDPKLLRAAIQRGNAYIAKHFQVAPDRYRYYYIYTLERYFTFREAVEGPEPGLFDWYTACAEYLLKTQQQDGSWMHQCGKVVDTSFAVLFLVRSTKQSMEGVRDYGPGVLVGSRGLPKQTDNVIVKNGQVVALPLRTSAEDLAAVLNSPEMSDLVSAIEAVEAMPPEEIRLYISDQAEKLRQLAGSDQPSAKIAAIAVMGKSGDLSYVPTLIYALGDSNPDVVIAADRALRRLTRTFGSGLQPGFSETERQAAIEQWKKWYRQIGPSADWED